MLYAYLNSTIDETPPPAAFARPSDDLAFEETRREGCLVLRVSGVVDAHTSPRLESRLTDAVSAGCPGVIVTLRDARFTDSSGVGVLVSALNAAEHGGVWIRLVATPSDTLQVLRSTALDTVLVTFASVTKAIRFKPASSSSALRADLTEERGYCRLVIEGAFDVSTAKPVESRLAEALGRGRRRFVVDLEDVTMIDAHGLGVLVGTARSVRARNGWVRVVCTDDQILKVFRITGLDRVLGVFATAEEAVAATRLPAPRRGGTA